MNPRVPTTPMVRLYNELHGPGVGRERRLEVARELVAQPDSLADDFRESIGIMAAYQPSDEGFYKSREHYEVGDVTGSSTTDLALRIQRAGGLSPRGSNGVPLLDTGALDAPGVTSVPTSELTCEYLDRELVATRTTGGAKHEGTAVRLDLLLCNRADRTPIIAEVKRTSDLDPTKPDRKPGTDKDAFSALIQALACAAQLATPAQYARIEKWGRAEARGEKVYPSQARIAGSDTPVFDVYIVLQNQPLGTFLPELSAEAERLAALLLARPGVAQFIRRIACLLTCIDAGDLRSRSEWAYEHAS